MVFVMRVLGMAGRYYNESEMSDSDIPDPAYIAEYDLDYEDGMGWARLTDDVNEAITFPSAITTFEAWRSVSPLRPTRPDGRPNRPLTAYTITPEQVK